MKVILVNGSPHEHGCTYTALREAEKALNAGRNRYGNFLVGQETRFGLYCMRSLPKTRKVLYGGRGKRIYGVGKRGGRIYFRFSGHYASAGGAITSFMDRAFYSGGAALRYKPAAAVASCRRAGGTATLDMLNKYFTISCMPVVSSSYWNEIHGNTAEEASKDAEGLQTMRTLGHNMAWLLKCIEAGRGAGIEPTKEKKVYTNFIR